MTYISPIAIDMGAKSTGVYFTHYPQGEEPLSTQGKTFSIDTTNFTLSLKDRLSNRHRMRAQKRRKLAKTLFSHLKREIRAYRRKSPCLGFYPWTHESQRIYFPKRRPRCKQRGRSPKSGLGDSKIFLS